MVNRKGPMFDANLHSATDSQLVGMDFRPKPVFLRLGKNPIGIFYSKEPFIAENIYKIGHRRSLRQHFLAYIGYILPLCPAPTYSMGAEKCRLNQRRGLSFEPIYHPEHFHLSIFLKAIAAFYLYGSRPLSDHLEDSFPSLTVQFFLGGAAKEVGGIQYSTSTRSDFFIGKAVDFVQKLPVATPCIDKVGMTVAKGRKHHSSTSRNGLIGLRKALGTRPERDYLSISYEQPSILENARFRHLEAAFFIDALG